MTIEEEKALLGQILDGTVNAAETLRTVTALDFELEQHKLIFRRMMDCWRNGDFVDRINVANELMKHGELQRAWGLSYLIELGNYEDLGRRQRVAGIQPGQIPADSVMDQWKQPAPLLAVNS